MRELAIYVHIPFCESKCLYCNFYSVTDKSKIQKYINKVKEQIEFFADKLKSQKVKSIYFGGGTPSSIDSIFIKEILDDIKAKFELKENVEISIECNPNTITNKLVESYLSFGINRFSLGLQSTNNEILKKINRKHTFEEFLDAVKIFKSLGVKNISADFILGLEGQDKKDVDTFIRTIKDFKIPHFSAYSLIVEEHTPLFVKVKNKEYVPLDDDTQVDLYDYLMQGLKNIGLNRYETSSFASLGYECTHNKCYWDYTDYIGFGVKAHSKIGDIRFSYEKNIKDFLEENDFENAFEVSRLDKDEQIFEYVMLALRTKYGVDKKRFFELFECDFEELFNDKINSEKVKDCFEITENNVVVKESKQYILNYILGEILY